MCVCPPLDKGFSTATPSTVFQPPFSTFYRQGGREDLQGSAQRSSLQDPRMRKLITSVYLLVLSQAVTPLFHFLFHGSSRFPPHKHSSPAAEQPGSLFRRLRVPTLFNNTVSADLSTLLFHHLPSHREIELTEYKCQSVFRSAVPLGC